MPTKTWVVGEEVLAADFNSFVQRQVIATFANAAARTAAIPAPTEGMASWLLDVDQLQIYRNTYWAPPPGTLVYSNFLTSGDINVTGPGMRDVLAVAQGISFTYPTREVCNVAVDGGFGGDWVSWMADVFSFYVNGPVSTGRSAANGAMWSQVGMTAQWSVPAGSPTGGFKVRFNPDRFGGGGNSVYYGVFAGIQIFAA